MAVPGFDRVGGLAALTEDEWAAHVDELEALWDAAATNATEPLSRVEFGLEFATGARRTRAQQAAEERRVEQLREEQLREEQLREEQRHAAAVADSVNVGAVAATTTTTTTTSASTRTQLHARGLVLALLTLLAAAMWAAFIASEPNERKRKQDTWEFAFTLMLCGGGAGLLLWASSSSPAQQEA